ncbi:phage tail protein I [Hartmannibacter diazotrophicus]|uniref:Phage tail protein I n=1 Tax=Hartmannibacter diazotrophicus TaxID=1482074 RepID=A0A2C9D5L0_9HYPH|nr:phage tail protein I [Hartmannibacter diazotrophicus]SON55533.1 phage tail protein I [Hartmannibacter diazotrophicus]
MPDPIIDAQVTAAAAVAEALLPISAMPLEKAILAAELARLGTYTPETIATIWNPATCPAVLLPWLAWAVSVDVWDAAWPESIQRAVIAAAPGVHRIKGARKALTSALAAMTVDCQITEWWQREPVGRRGTFDVIAFARTSLYDDARLLDAKTIAAIDQTIRRAKPKSRVYTLAVGALAAGSIGVSGTATAELRGRVDARAGFRPKRTITLGLAATGTAQIHVRLDMRAT